MLLYKDSHGITHLATDSGMTFCRENWPWGTPSASGFATCLACLGREDRRRGDDGEYLRQYLGKFVPP